MSWLRSAVSKAVEVSSKNNLTRTVRSYADTVGHAVAEGAKLFQDRMGARSFKSFRHTVKRLEEVAVSCRGLERTQVLRRWLVVLKEIEQLSEGSVDNREKFLEQPNTSDEPSLSPRKSSMVLYYDPDLGGEPMNFRDVFLHSQALEGIALSMILEAPNEEEVSLLLEIFGLCLTGGKEVHNAVLSSIQDLAKAIASYQDEVLVKREELLQFAQGAITGLKLNADVARIDAEASALQQKLEGMKTSRVPSTEGEEITPVETTHATLEALKQALAEVRVCSKLEALLLKKKSLNNGDSPDIRSQKVDKLKVLADSLASSTLKAEKRISDHRHQKEEALNFRLAKANEVTELEKEISTEIAGLEKQRDELEAKLKKVNISLAAALARLHNNREEREKFEEASNQIVLHLKAKEDELSRSVASCKVEADVVHTWINFLEDTWILQSSYMDQKEKQNNDELEKHNNYFMNVVIHHLSAYKEELGRYVIQIRKLVDNLKNFDKSRSAMMSNLGTENSDQLKNLEVEYLEYEAKIITTFSVVDHMKEQFYSHDGNISRHDEPKVKELFDAIEQIKVDFESIERPTLEIETPSEEGSQKSQSHTIQSSESSPQEGEESSNSAVVTKPSKEGESPKSATVMVTIPSKEGESPNLAPVTTNQTLDAEAELAKLESEFGKVSRDYSADEIGGWEFDELEQELKSGDSVSAK
ncbi:uncharacterized protein LOC131253057 isoform X2 [Magnolia sinica]|uniref:uncharacterized protein LOC131253057 isoform X2 n=1 Tax=Magnolia sinica TaxID=86752 RepID=UPI0026587052|nr:uncharacterized protein LOC131253057 isoform X2 [Magnolia sinica]